MGNDNPKPVRGDLIEIERGMYNHWAVYIGYGEVVHFGAIGQVSSSASMSDTDGEVRLDRLADVVGDDKWAINNTKHTGVRPRPPDDIVRDAKAAVGKRMRYNLTSNNCEHFATKLRYGKAMSTQVDNAAAGVGVLGVLGGLAIIGMAMAGGRTTNYH